MTISGTYTFNLEVDKILEQAFDKVGGEHVSGADAKKARTKLNLILIEMQNKEIPISQIDEVTVTAVEDQREYTLSANVNDVLAVNLMRSSVEMTMGRLGLIEYHQIPRKSQKSRPTMYTTERDVDAVTMKVWPTPENSTDTFEITFFKRIDDITKSAGENVALNIRYLPSIVNILAYEIAKDRDGISEEKMGRLKMDWMDSWNWVKQEDRERATNYAVPHLRSPLT